jgi:exodeoxyribonuclease VII small subunit
MNQLTFEEAISKLEVIIGRMEGGKTPLQESLEDYEEATRLVRYCTEMLANAEKKLTVLTEEERAGVDTTIA